MLVTAAKVTEAHNLPSSNHPSAARSLAYTHTHRHTQSYTHTLAQQSTQAERPVWRSLAHLSLYQAVSRSLQRRCRFEECATVGRMNLHDELGIYLFIFQPTAPRHITIPKSDFHTEGSSGFYYPLKGDDFDDDCGPWSAARWEKKKKS